MRQVVSQLNELLYELSLALDEASLTALYQQTFGELQRIADGLEKENYSKSSWASLEATLLSNGEAEVQFATQLQQAFATFAGLTTKFEEEQLLLQDVFLDLQETILAIEDLLVETSENGVELEQAKQWTTLEARAEIKHAVEKALDVYIKFDPTIEEIITIQNQLDQAIIAYEQSKLPGKKDDLLVGSLKQQLQEMINELQLVAVSKDGLDIYTNAQWTTPNERTKLNKIVAQVKEGILNS